MFFIFFVQGRWGILKWRIEVKKHLMGNEFMEIHKKILKKMVLRGNKNKIPREWDIKILLTTSNAIK